MCAYPTDEHSLPRFLLVILQHLVYCHKLRHDPLIILQSATFCSEWYCAVEHAVRGNGYLLKNPEYYSN
jgi:hypothetical protein